MPTANEKHIIKGGGTEIGAAIYDAKRGHWVANCWFDKQLIDDLEDDTWTIGGFTTLKLATEAIVRLSGSVVNDVDRRALTADFKSGTKTPTAEHERLKKAEDERPAPRGDIGGGGRRR